MVDRAILVTGAAGFIGANLCRRLVSEGKRPHVVVKPKTDLWRISGIQHQLVLHELDLCDAAGLQRLVGDIRPQCVYHLATHGAYPQQNDADQILRVNVLGSWNLISACASAGCELLVNLGTSSEYGHKETPMRESDRLDPDSYYAVAKSAQSMLARFCSRQGVLPTVTLRLFSAYGPFEAPGRLIPRLMMASIQNRFIEMVHPDTARDFIYIDDVVDLLMDVDSLKKLGPDPVNVGTGIQSRMTDVIQTMSALIQKEMKVRWGAMAPRPWDKSTWVADTSRFREQFGKGLKTDLAQGLAKCIPWFTANAHLYKDLS